jgi:hypothetical protein
MVPALLISLSHSLSRFVRSSTEPLAHRDSRRRCEKANRKNQSYPSEDMGNAIVPRINFLILNGIVINFHRHIGCAEWFGMKTALLMQRALLHGQRLQGDHPYNLAGAVTDLHFPPLPNFRRQRSLSPEFLDRLVGKGDSGIDVFQLATFTVVNEVAPIGKVEVVTGRHGRIDALSSVLPC